MRKFIIITITVIFICLVIAGIYYFLERPSEQNPPEIQTTHPPCLSENEIVDYSINWRQKVDSIDIVIKDKKSGNEVSRFSIDSVLHVYYPVQPRKCGVYVLRIFNFNPTDILKSASENKYEIWYYSYNGESKSVLLLSKDFSLEFSVDFLEVYLALIRGYLGHIDFATVIKEIATKNDVFSLEHKDIVNKYPDLIGVFDLDGWTKDSRYFWGHISYGANVFGFFRIERDAWKVDILPVSERILGGTAFNLEYGYLTYDTGPGWIGIHQIAEQIYDEWRKEGKKVDFYLYNLFTKEKTLLATTDDPSWSFKPKWISDTELEYFMPSGEKKIYKIKVGSAILGRASISYFLSGDSPAEILVTDPQGRRLGKDPLNNISYNEMPGGVYYQEGIGDPFAEEPTPTRESKIIWIPNPISGKYNIKIIGTDIGTYVTELSAYDIYGNSRDLAQEGDITTNGVEEFELNYSRTTVEELRLNRVIGIK